MRLAYFSPLTPKRSGISDYSEELLPLLTEHAEIALFVDGFQPMNRELTSRFEVLDYRRKRSHLRKLDDFDVVLYHMGNDHRYHAGMLEAMQTRSGVVVFHDFALQDFFLGLARDRSDLRVYLNEVERCYGWKARDEAADFLSRDATPPIVNQPLEFPLNCNIAKSAEGIIVHSAWQAERFARLAPGVPCARINHHITREAAEAAPPADRSASGPVRIASFGLITPDKGIERALRVLAKLKSVYDFRYTLVGSDSNFPELTQIIARHGLSDRVSVTGHVSLEEFQQWMARTDIAICLRERSVGATSGSLCRIMAAGVAAIVSDIGAFSEFPNDSVVKVEPGNATDALLEAYLRKLIEDEPLRTQIGLNARAHVLAEHRIEDSANKYIKFLHQIIAGRARRGLVNEVANELATVGMRASDNQLLRSIATEVAMLAPTASFESVTDSLRPGQFTPETPINQNGHGNDPVDPAHGRGGKIEGIDYKRGAREYLSRISEERRHHLRTKPFYNLANKPAKYTNFAMDEDTHRHFCDFANIAVTLALPPGSRILDVGCGSGWLSEYFARLGYVVKGIDISPDLIEMSRERVARVPYGADHETPLRCTFEVHDVELSPLQEKFDAVICYDSLHHFEDDAAVIEHAAQMLDIGGQLFVLEGDRPHSGSSSDNELRDVMREFGTLEAPFDYPYLRQLLEENGFAITGDYVSVNGLFPRDELNDQQQLSLRNVDTNFHYVACKKVAHGKHASTVPDSRSPNDLKARITTDSSIARLSAGEKFAITVTIRNTGDTLWLAGAEPRTGIVMPATLITDDQGTLVSEVHGEPVLPHAVAPGETVTLNFERTAPHRSGKYSLKIDLVDQHICWFERRGSHPLVIEFQVA